MPLGLLKPRHRELMYIHFTTAEKGLRAALVATEEGRCRAAFQHYQGGYGSYMLAVANYNAREITKPTKATKRRLSYIAGLWRAVHTRLATTCLRKNRR